jgi:hypothetical protein
MSGALINARLDRVLGKDVVRKILHDAESDGIEKLRQACLYIDLQDGVAVTPEEMIDEQRSRVFVILAGELVAEVLGALSVGVRANDRSGDDLRTGDWTAREADRPLMVSVAQETGGHRGFVRTGCSEQLLEPVMGVRARR